MVRSMFAAVAGLRTHQTKMDVIGNNIANVNTYGYKASRATFTDVYYQTLQGASAPQGNAGGTNPLQIGYGSTVGSVDVLNTRAGSATTDRPMDVYISGDGYIPLVDADGGVFFTRVGVLGFDVSGNLIDSNGFKVLGIPLDPNTGNPVMSSDGTIALDALQTISVDPKDLDKYTSISIGKNGDITVVEQGPIEMSVAAGFSAKAPWLTGISVSEGSTLGGKFNLLVTDAVAPATGATITVTGQDEGGTPHAFTGTLSAGAESIILTSTTSQDRITLTVNTGRAKQITTYHALVKDEDYPDDPDLFTYPMADAIEDLYNTYENELDDAAFSPRYTTANLQALSGSELAKHIQDIVNAVNGETPDTLDYDEIMDGTGGGDPLRTIAPTYAVNDGKVPAGGVFFATAASEAGAPKKIAQLGITKFRNPDGLLQEGSGYVRQSANSGDAVSVIPGTKGTGNTTSGALEMSNVDLSKEFSDMITTQRGFQANTRIITVTDEMLSELVNMKR